MKPGYKTTEFWLTALAGLVGFVVASGMLESLAETHWVVKAIGGITTLLTVLGYQVARGKVKTAEVNEKTAEALRTPAGGSDTSGP